MNSTSRTDCDPVWQKHPHRWSNVSPIHTRQLRGQLNTVGMVKEEGGHRNWPLSLRPILLSLQVLAEGPPLKGRRPLNPQIASLHWCRLTTVKAGSATGEWRRKQYKNVGSVLLLCPVFVLDKLSKCAVFKDEISLCLSFSCKIQSRVSARSHGDGYFLLPTQSFPTLHPLIFVSSSAARVA